MTKSALFMFEEPEHLTRISLKLGLEDIGFIVEEDRNCLAIAGGRGMAGNPTLRSKDHPSVLSEDCDPARSVDTDPIVLIA